MLSTLVFFNLEVSIQALGGISGGNFNPAVSVALGCLQSLKGPGMDWKQVGHWNMEVLGGILWGLKSYSAIWGIFNVKQWDTM